jgi:ubiquinone/menaquinone biosynthesis C-methylase UbiE
VTTLSLSTWLDRLVWRLAAPVYDRLGRHVAPGRSWVADALDLSGDDRVLLLGCGTGLDLEYLPTDATVVAVDRSPQMVRQCRHRAGKLGLDLETRTGDARSVASPDGAFDAVLVHLLLSVADDPAAVLAESSRVLTDGGWLSILDEPVPWAADFPDDHHGEPLRAAGLVADRSESFGPYTATIATHRPGRSRPPSRSG